MNVSVKEIANQFGATKEEITQIGSKQLFIVQCNKHYDSVTRRYYRCPVLVSYKTIVGFFHTADNEWKLTSKTYSRTTSKQLTQFSSVSSGRKVSRVSEAQFETLLAEVTI